MKLSDIARLDREHVWHPYAPLPSPAAPLPVVSAEGVRLRLADGRELIDGMSSWWCAIHGYRHPVLDAAVREQLGRMAHVMFGGLTHEPAVRLAQRLAELAPDGLEHVFFADSGSVAVEVAIKMALQCQRARGEQGRTRLMTVRGGYHGDTFGAMAVCDPVGGMHSLFTGVLPEHVFAERPPDGFREPPGEQWGVSGEQWRAQQGEQWGASGEQRGSHGEQWGSHGEQWGSHGEQWGSHGEQRGMHGEQWGVSGERGVHGSEPEGSAAHAGELERWAAHVRDLAERHAGELAAVIVEPIVQGAGGMRFHSPACVRLLRELCDELGMLLILDEIATGFGRTGALFACEHAGVRPDIMCVGKALTGGYMTLAATLCTSAVARSISSGEGGALMHGPTYMANPLACSVALASLDLLGDGTWRHDVRRIERGLRDGLAPARGLPGVSDVRVLGAIGVVQMESEVNVSAATAAAVERGVWLRPFRDLIYTMPPYVTGDDDLATVTAAVVAAAAA